MLHFRRGLAAALFILFLSTVSAEDIEVTVTATKASEPSQTLPVGVVVLSPEDWKDKTTVTEALSSTLAVRVDTLIPGQETLDAPGFGENGFGRILLLVDGFSQNNADMKAAPLNLIPLFALDRIEVVRGPAPAFYGDGAVTGAVNLVTKVPRRFEATASASIDTTLTNSQSFGAGFPLGAGGLLLSATRDQSKPTRDRSDSDQYQAWSKITLPFVLGGLENEFSAWASFSKLQSELPGSLTQAQYSSNPNSAVNLADESALTETKGQASWAVLGTNWSMTAPVSATYRAVKSTTVSSSTFSDSGYTALAASPRFELDLGTTGAAAWTVSGGSDVSWARMVVDLYDGTSFTNRTGTATVNRLTAAGWTRLEASWDEKLFVSSSVRFEGSQTASASETDSAIPGSKSFFPLSGQVGVSWLPTEGVHIGLEGSRVYRYPFIDEIVSYYGWSNGFNNDLDPESGYGTSVTADWTIDAVRVAATATALAMDNEIAYAAAPISKNANIGKTTHFSALLQGSYKTGPAVWGAEYSFEAARVAAGENEGKQIPLVPAHRGRLWAKVDWDRIGSADASWQLTSGFFEGGDAANAKPLISGAQSLDVGATAFLGTPHLSLRVYGKNLTNDRTPNYVYYGGWYPIEGRTFGTSLTWKL